MIISVVIPCYNVSRHIEDVIRNLPASITWIITVNDCSTDETEYKLTNLQKDNKKIIYIRHDTNQGVGGAVLTGFM